MTDKERCIRQFYGLPPYTVSAWAYLDRYAAQAFEKKYGQTIELHRWDGYVGYTDKALTILQELTELCNECHGPMADECPCPIESVRKQCFDYLKEQLDIYRNRTNAGDYKQWCDALDAVLTAYSEHIKQPTICEWEPDDSHSLGGTLFHVNPAWDRFVQGVDALRRGGEH